MMEKDFSNAQRAEVLTQALPYIKQYNGKIVVVKYGGNAMINEQLKEQVMEDIALLWLIGVKIVLVHGGGPEISELMNRLGKKAEFVDGLRVTDKETVDIVQMVLAGKINKSLVNLLEMKGGRAMGISGMDGRLIEAKMRDPRLGYVGAITHINIDPVNDLLERGYIPVISTIGCDRDGNAYNINGDTAAAFIAGLFCVAGVIRLMSWYRQRSMKGSWLQLVIGVLDIVIAWIFLGATPMVSVTLVSTLVGIELIFSAASLFSFASLFVKQQ